MRPVALLSTRKAKPPKTLVYSLWTMTNSEETMLYISFPKLVGTYEPDSGSKAPRVIK